MIFQTDERARHSGAEPYSGADRDARRADGATNARGGPVGASAPAWLPAPHNLGGVPGGDGQRPVLLAGQHRSGSLGAD